MEKQSDSTDLSILDRQVWFSHDNSFTFTFQAQICFPLVL